MSSSLQITVLEQKGNGSVTVMHLKGELDGNTYKDMEAKAEELLAGDTINILVDLSDVSYMGSAGLRALQTTSNGAKEKDGAVKLLNPSDAVGRVMHTLGFDQFFEIFDDLDNALSSF